MKLNCGPTPEEKSLANWRRLHNWHPFFCLLPRRITGTHECIWLETIERKGEYVCRFGGSYWEWEYRVKDRSTGLDGPGGIED